MRDYFTPAETACKCGCGLDVIAGTPFEDRLNDLRERYGAPLFITSGTRCPDYNAKVSGTGRDGPHTKGAVDFSIERGDAWRLLLIALDMGFKGIGVKQHGGGRFLHLDDLPDEPGQPRPTVWSYP